jgi:hypothetical protein
MRPGQRPLPIFNFETLAVGLTVTSIKTKKHTVTDELFLADEPFFFLSSSWFPGLIDSQVSRL